jgi:2-dehydropantoate 2-reductase
VGGKLQAAGAEVCFVGRPRVLDALRAHGLKLTDRSGGSNTLAPDRLQLQATPQGASPGLVLLCVKSGATAAAAQELAAALPPGTLVVSLQNGVANAEIGAQAAPALGWLPGMVPFNIAELAPGHFHRGTSGAMAVQDHPALQPWLALFAAAGLPLSVHKDLRAVQWGKLLLNLNNPVNALSGLPLRAQLLNRGYRCVLAALQAEALAAMRAAGITPAQLGPTAPRWVPHLLRLPDWIFTRVAKRMLRIDAKARSSMADDLALGRSTEVDAICGAVVRLAQAHGGQAPCNAQMVELLSVPKPAPLSASALRAALGV